MAWVATAIVGGAAVGLVGASMQSDAAENAAQMQYQATQSAQDQQLKMFNTLNAQQTPYREAGYGALNSIQSMLPQLNKPFTAQDLNSYLAPNYQFMLNQGL